MDFFHNQQQQICEVAACAGVGSVQSEYIFVDQTLLHPKQNFRVVPSAFCNPVSAVSGTFFSDAESTDISALDADDFTDVTLAKVTLLM